MNKKNGLLIVLVTLVVLSSAGFAFCLGKMSAIDDKNDSVVSENNESGNISNEDIVYNNWTEYLLAQEIKRAYIYQWSSTEETFFEKTIVISKDDLKEILTEMYKSDLYKLDNVEGGDTTPDLYVVYELNGQEETLHFSLCKSLYVDNTTSSDLIQYLEKETPVEVISNDMHEGEPFVVYDYQWDYEPTINKILSKYKTN